MTYFGSYTAKYTWKYKTDENLGNFQKDALDSHAMERIEEMRKKGFTEGELHHELEGKTYDGWWWFEEE